jgi:DNA-3-methyladenine glycosylase I
MLQPEKYRCAWAQKDPMMRQYHDNEWGVPVHDDFFHFEFMVLDAFQAGLSWLTILKKRESFRMAFENFDYNKVAAFTEIDFDRLMNDTGIVRNKLKIASTINNAVKFKEIVDEFGSFDNYIWRFVNNGTIVNNWKSMKEVPPKSDLSDVMSKALLKKGFRFVGSTICYSYMQAAGMINDHEINCFRHKHLST